MDPRTKIKSLERCNGAPPFMTRTYSPSRDILILSSTNDFTKPLCGHWVMLMVVLAWLPESPKVLLSLKMLVVLTFLILLVSGVLGVAGYWRQCWFGPWATSSAYALDFSGLQSPKVAVSSRLWWFDTSSPTVLTLFDYVGPRSPQWCLAYNDKMLP